MRVAFYVFVSLTLAIAEMSLGQVVEGRDYVLPSWGDIVYSYGPGVDPSLDSPAAFEHMVRHWQGRGFRGVFLRTDLAQLDPNSIRRNPIGNQENPALAEAWAYIDEVSNRFNVHKIGNEISEKDGFEFWAWHAHTFSDGAPETAGSPGPGRMWPWSYVSIYTYTHPEAVTTDRTHTRRQWMVREYGYPEARATKVAEFVYMARKLGLKHFVVENRSEASQMQNPPDNADRFGFNDIVVRDMQRCYGVNILTDPRFDVDSPKFSALDPMVENWHRLRGEYFTQFLRELRRALNEVDPKIQICVSIAGERIGPPMGNWFTDWRTWVDEGLIDAIVTPCDFDAWPTSADILKTYITCVKQGRGIVPLAVFRNYIKSSKHPDIRLISGGGSYFFQNPPSNGDSWRTTDWYDSYQMAWFQRWNQLMKDLDEFGYIKFFDQSFDGFPVNSSYYSGGYGNKGYVPALRACPGLWYRMGDGSNSLPCVQSQVRYGFHGNAVKLTSDPTRSTELIARHSSNCDRSLYYSCIEPAIQNGQADFEFRVFRGSDESGLIAYFQDGSDVKPDIAIRITPGTGALEYSVSGTWRPANIFLPKQVWKQIRIGVDFAAGSYSAYVVNEKVDSICSSVPYMHAGPRVIPTDDGSGRTVAMKSCKMLNQLDFVPEGKMGAVTYLDDVIVQWRPLIPYEKAATHILFADDFERFDPGMSPVSQKPQIGSRWVLKGGDATQAVIENNSSYGEGTKCLRIWGNMALLCQGADAPPSQKCVLDLDVFIRSNSPYVDIMPSAASEMKQGIEIGLNGGNDESDRLAIKTDNGFWSSLRYGVYTKSSVPVALDCWNHVQLTIDNARRSYKVVLQPVGEMPAVLTEGTAPVAFGAAAENLVIRTTATDNVFRSSADGSPLVNFVCVDNVHLTAD